MHRSVLEDEDFIAWANQNVVVVVGNGNASGKHDVGDAKDDDEKGDAKDGKKDDGKDDAKKDDGKGEGEATEPTGEGAPPAGGGDVDCTYYPGLKCREHAAISSEVHAPKGDEPKIPDFQGVPASFLIGADGTVEECKEDRAPSSLQGAIEDFQKKLKAKPLPFKKYEGYLTAIGKGDEAVEAGKWKVALAEYAKVDKDGKKYPGLAARVGKRAEAMDAKVVEAFEKAKEEADAAARLKAVKALRAEVGAKLSTGNLPVVATIDAWLKENAATTAAK
jgi:hypothetical protein